MAEILFVMLNPANPDFESDRDFWCGMILVISALFGFFSWIQYYIFGYAGENLIFEIRKELFKGILYK